MRKELKTINLDVKALIELFNRFEIEELNLEENGIKFELRRELPLDKRPPQTQVMPTYTMPLTTAIEEKPSKKGESAEEKAIAEEEKYAKILSPMSGTFYRSPAPEEAPFVKEGDFVSPSTTVCIIEAMKMMNEIKSEISGKIVKILAQNGEVVNVGKPLFLLTKD